MNTIDVILDVMLVHAVIASIVTARIQAAAAAFINERKLTMTKAVGLYIVLGGYFAMGMWTWLAFELHHWQLAAYAIIPWLIRLAVTQAVKK